jgi:cytochrome bd-type quinol oxidase subunit 1
MVGFSLSLRNVPTNWAICIGTGVVAVASGAILFRLNPRIPGFAWFGWGLLGAGVVPILVGVAGWVHGRQPMPPGPLDASHGPA